MKNRPSMMLLLTLVTSAVIYSGCGSDAAQPTAESSTKTIKSQTSISTYINKGNFVEVASFAYQKVTDPSVTQNSMEIQLPGSEVGEVIELSQYDVSTLASEDQLNKIIVQNHLNRLEVKFLENDQVNIILQATNYTIDRKMTLAEFTAK